MLEDGYRSRIVTRRAWRCALEGRFDVVPGHARWQQDCDDAGCAVSRLELPDLEVTCDAAHPQATLGKSLRVRAARDQAHFRSGPGEPAAGIASDAACPADRDTQALLASARGLSR
jgi:hypothetical protein